MMNERPILFSGAMVRTILEGRKTQTRRVVKPQPPLNFSNVNLAYGGSENIPSCPYGQPGDRLWVRETHRYGNGEMIEYRADGEKRFIRDNAEWLRPDNCGEKWKPSIFMPRWASRITLDVVGVRVERLQDISPSDAEAEGVPSLPDYCGVETDWSPKACFSAVPGFVKLWDSINATRGYSWESNPWVWVVEFRRVEEQA